MIKTKIIFNLSLILNLILLFIIFRKNKKTEEEKPKAKVLVLHHGSENNTFWQDIESNFLNETDFTFEFQRFSNNTEEQALYIKELYLNQTFIYDAVVSTVLSEDISDQLSALSRYIPIITFNSVIKPLKDNLFEYCGVGNQGEVKVGLDLSLSMAIFAHNFLSITVNEKYTTINLEKGLATKSGIVNDFLNDIEKYDIQMVSYFDEINNIAYSKRYEGIQKFFPESIRVFNLEKLKETFSDKNKKYLVSIGGIGSLTDVENIISEVNTQNPDISILLIGVCDNNPIIKNLLEDKISNLTNYSGSEPSIQVEQVVTVLKKIIVTNKKNTYRKSIEKRMPKIKTREISVTDAETSTIENGRSPYSVNLDTPMLRKFNSKKRTENKSSIITKLMDIIYFFGEDNNEWAYGVKLSNNVVEKIKDGIKINPKDFFESTYTVFSALDDAGFQITTESLNNIKKFGGVRNIGETYTFKDTYKLVKEENYRKHPLVLQVMDYIGNINNSSYIKN